MMPALPLRRCLSIDHAFANGPFGVRSLPGEAASSSPPIPNFQYLFPSASLCDLCGIAVNLLKVSAPLALTLKFRNIFRIYKVTLNQNYPPVGRCGPAAPRRRLVAAGAQAGKMPALPLRRCLSIDHVFANGPFGEMSLPGDSASSSPPQSLPLRCSMFNPIRPQSPIFNHSYPPYQNY